MGKYTDCMACGGRGTAKGEKYCPACIDSGQAFYDVSDRKKDTSGVYAAYDFRDLAESLPPNRAFDGRRQITQ